MRVYTREFRVEICLTLSSSDTESLDVRKNGFLGPSEKCEEPGRGASSLEVADPKGRTSLGAF